MIQTRKDGTFVIEVNGMPYHVISTDPKYWDEVQQRIADGEETEQEVPSSPGNDYEWNDITAKWELTLIAYKLQVQLSINIIRLQRLDDGFMLGQHTIRADNYSQTKLQMYYIRIMDNNLTFPVQWRTKENVYYSISNISTLRTLITAFNSFVKTTYEDSWSVKDAIELTQTNEEVETLYQEYLDR